MEHWVKAKDELNILASTWLNFSIYWSQILKANIFIWIEILTGFLLSEKPISSHQWSWSATTIYWILKALDVYNNYILDDNESQHSWSSIALKPLVFYFVL